MPELPPSEREKQERYRDARYGKYYDNIWQSTGKCVFCDLREKYLLFEQDGVVLAITLYAYIDGDMMIIPRRHVTTTSELNDKEWNAVRKLMYLARKMIRKAHDIRGVQFIQRHGGIQAQSTVGHLHIKCIPFDAPDLAVWNYRKLKYTPLENVERYKQLGKTIVGYDAKFEERYTNLSHLPLVCDAIILNEENEVLFEKRKEQHRFVPEVLVVPGGAVTDFSKSFEEELVREVAEETGLALDPRGFSLVASRVSQIVRSKESVHLNERYQLPHRFMLNTYLYNTRISKRGEMRPGDDCEELLWIPHQHISAHEQVSPEAKRILSTVRV